MNQPARRVSAIVKKIAVPAALLASGFSVSLASHTAYAAEPTNTTIVTTAAIDHGTDGSHTLAGSDDHGTDGSHTLAGSAAAQVATSVSWKTATN